MRNVTRLLSGLNMRALVVLASVLIVGTLVAPRASAEDSTAQCFVPAGGGSLTIVLDPGHGGSDYGTSGYNGLRESELNLNIAERTRDILLGNGYRVCLTRTQQTPNWSNSQRGEYANQEGAVRLVLIHFNGSSDKTVNYTKTFWGKKNKDLAFSQVIHDALWPTLQKDPTDPTRTVNLTDGKVGQFATGALLKSTMPGTLAETVFLTNPAEADRLADARTADDLKLANTMNRRQQIAAALADGIMTSLK